MRSIRRITLPAVCPILILIPMVILIMILMMPSAGRAQTDSMPPMPGMPAEMMTDRPGFTFSGMTVGRGVFQAELGLPSGMVNDMGSDEMRTLGLVGLLRYGLTDRFELRLGSPVYTETRMKMDGLRSTDRGFGDVEVGAKWQLLDNQGARPAFALIPSVILPVGQKGFTSGDPVYQLNTATEWMSGGWDLMLLAGFLNGKSNGDEYRQETLAAWLGRQIAPRWWLYGEAAHVVTDLPGASDSSFLGAGLKYLVTGNLQLDAGFDHGLTAGSPDWMFGFGLSVRF